MSPTSSLSGSRSWCVAAPLLAGKGDGHRLEKWLWKGSWGDTRAQPCLPAQQTAWSAALGGVGSPAPFSALFFTRACVPAAVAIWVALGSPCSGGRDGLSPWARMSPHGWEMSGVSYSSLLTRQEAWDSRSAFRLWKPKQEPEWRQAFFQIFFSPYRWGCL